MKNSANFKEFSGVLKPVKLFKDIIAQDLEFLLDCMDARKKIVKKGKMILLAGDKPAFVGIVLSGLLHVLRDDYDGNRSLVAALSEGDIFAEALCCAGISESPASRAAVRLLCPDKISYLPFSNGRTIIGSKTPLSLMLSVISFNRAPEYGLKTCSLKSTNESIFNIRVSPMQTPP